ncbi:hypothetical protein G6F68_016519 [Rhizopus microsporus]|nr:hypothetical protein G6F68_016519 [Rhizopus microsporus]
MQAGARQQHIDQDQRDQYHPHDRLAMLRIRTLRQLAPHACEQVLHVTPPVASMPSSAGRRYPSAASGRASAHPRSAGRTTGHAGHTDRPAWLPWSMLPCTDGAKSGRRTRRPRPRSAPRGEWPRPPGRPGNRCRHSARDGAVRSMRRPG